MSGDEIPAGYQALQKVAPDSEKIAETPLINSDSAVRRQSLNRSQSMHRSQTQLEFDQGKQEAVKRVLGARNTGPNMSEVNVCDANSSVDKGEDPVMDALRNLVSHVRLDPDGGLENVVAADAFLSGDFSQVSKVEHLKKDSLEQMGAWSVVFRVLGNICFVVWRGYSTLSAVFFAAQSEKAMELHKRQQQVRIPYIMELTGMVAVVEISCLVYLLLAVLFRASRVASLWQNPDQRYFHLAKLFWHDLLQLQNVSALKALGYVHPTILAKRKQTLFTGDLCSKFMLTKFFKAKEDDLSQEEMAVQVGKIVLRARWRELETIEDRQATAECVAFATNAVDASPHDALTSLAEALAELTPAERTSVLEGVCADESVLAYAWRVDFMVLVEKLFFMLGNVVLLIVGFSGAIVKVSAGAVVLTDPDVDLFWIYFWIAAFCNQIIGVFSIEEMLLQRVHTFVFGGTDARVQMEEQFLIDIYMGHLMQRIWMSDHQHLSLGDKIALLCKLDDDDLQQLIVEEDFGQKSAVLLSVRRHLTQHQLQGLSMRAREQMGRWASKLE